MRFLISLVALFLAACATSNAPVQVIDQPYSGKLMFYPPDKYMDNAIMVVVTFPQSEVAARCNVSPNTVACAPGSVYVVVPNPCEFPGEYFAELLCHEKAHINGWNSDHNN